MNWSILLATATLLTLAFAACGGNDANSSSKVQLYTIRIEVVDEEGLAVNGANVTGGDIFGATEQGGVLERSMVNAEQYRQHLDATYQVEKSGCIVDKQEVHINEGSEGFATISLQLACVKPLVILPGVPTSLLFDSENIWLATLQENSLTKLRTDGRVLGVFPVEGVPHHLTFDGLNIWVAVGQDIVIKIDTDGRNLGTFNIQMANLKDVEDRITDLAFDGEGIWVSHRTGGANKLALDGTVLWTASRWNPWVGNYEHLLFTGNKMVRMEGLVIGRRALRTFDLEGNHLQYKAIGSDDPVKFQTTFGNVWDATFDDDGIWLASSGGVLKISTDGRVVLGPFPTSVGGGEKELIVDRQYIWVAEETFAGAGLVSKLFLDGQMLGTYSVGLYAASLVSDGNNIWAATLENRTRSGDFPDSPTTSLWKIIPD